MKLRDQCPACKGRGQDVHTTCPVCKGKGLVHDPKNNSIAGCVECGSFGIILHLDCPLCNGKGYRDWIDKIRRPMVNK